MKCILPLTNSVPCHEKIHPPVDDQKQPRNPPSIGRISHQYKIHPRVDNSITTKSSLPWTKLYSPSVQNPPSHGQNSIPHQYKILPPTDKTLFPISTKSSLPRTKLYSPSVQNPPLRRQLHHYIIHPPTDKLYSPSLRNLRQLYLFPTTTLPWTNSILYNQE